MMKANNGMKTSTRVAAGLAAAMLGLGGCSAPATSAADATAEPSAQASAAEEGLETQAAGEEAKVAMDGEGVTVTGADGKVQHLAFGMGHDELMRAIAFRGPAGETTNQECGAGPVDFASWPDGLNLLFQQGEFAGWSLDERADTIVTASGGVGIGSPRSALAALGTVEVEESTLGTEFTAGGIGGLLDGPGKGAKVTALWAGLTCMFR